MIVNAIQAAPPNPKAATSGNANQLVRRETIALISLPPDASKRMMLAARLCADGRTFRSAKAAFDPRDLVLEMQLPLLEPCDEEFVAAGLLAER